MLYVNRVYHCSGALWEGRFHSCSVQEGDHEYYTPCHAMPRRARIALPNIPVHLIQRGNNRQPCFFADEDYRRYLDWLCVQ